MTVWGVIYKDLDTLTKVVSGVEVIDPDFGIGTSIHTFETGLSTSNGKRLADLYKDLVTLEGRPIEFSFQSASGTSRVWKQSVIKVTIVDHQNSPNGTHIKMVCADRSVLMTHSPKSDIHEVKDGKVSNLIKTLLEGVSLKVGLIQETDQNPEFSLLCQPYISDYQLISDFIIPRSASGEKAGYRLWSVDGETFNYITPDYQANEVTLPNENATITTDTNATHEAAKLGGYFLQSVSFSMAGKAIVEAESEESNKTFGDYYGEWRKPSFARFPTISTAGLQAMTRSMQRAEADYAYPFEITLNGIVGIDGKPFERPSVIVANTDHKSSGKLKGLLAGTKYSYRGKRINVTLYCLRYQTTL